MGQCQISIKNIFFIKYIIFSNGNGNEMAVKKEIEGLKFLQLIEPARLLGLKDITYGRIGPGYNLIIITT